MDGVGELSGIVEQSDLGEFSAPARGMLFSIDGTRTTEGDVLKIRHLISGYDRTSLHPPHTHTHTFPLPHSSVIREWKRNLVFTVTARLLLHCEQTQGCGKEADRRTSSLVSTVKPEEQEQIGSVLLM